MMNKSGLLIVYSGPSGVGKGTLLKPYLKTHPQTVLSVSMTTRAPREGETDGVEYYFVSKEQFEQMISQNGFLEYAQYSGNYYGTPRKMVEEQLAAGKDVVLEIEVQGAQKIRKSFPDAVFIFILPPDYETLERRLIGRGTEDLQTVSRRLAAAKEELSYAQKYDYQIVNDDLQEAQKCLEQAILDAYKRKNMEKN